MSYVKGLGVRIYIGVFSSGRREKRFVLTPSYHVDLENRVSIILIIATKTIIITIIITAVVSLLTRDMAKW